MCLFIAICRQWHIWLSQTAGVVTDKSLFIELYNDAAVKWLDLYMLFYVPSKGLDMSIIGPVPLLLYFTVFSLFRFHSLERRNYI